MASLATSTSFSFETNSCNVTLWLLFNSCVSVNLFLKLPSSDILFIKCFSKFATNCICFVSGTTPVFNVSDIDFNILKISPFWDKLELMVVGLFFSVNDCKSNTILILFVSSVIFKSLGKFPSTVEVHP